MNDHPDCPRIPLYTAADLVAALREASAERDRLDAVNPARLVQLRPDFFECASIEEIDSQIRQAQTQQRAWADREQTLGILRQARVKQMELGEWPAAVQTGAECQS